MAVVSKKMHIFHELKRNLRSFGFVNVTGLEWVATIYDESGYIQADKKTLCRWTQTDEIIFAVLENGEVWMRHGELNDHLRNFLRRICPRGRGAMINLPQEYIIDFRQILDRVNDPYSAFYCDPTSHPCSL